MPRAKEGDNAAKTSAAAIRIRENQRRSRARRKEYVEGMQRKLQEYETKGVAATLEMQQAARDVAIENSRLRLLLSHNGVSGLAIDTFLQSFKHEDDAAAAAEAEAQMLRVQTQGNSNSSSSNSSSGVPGSSASSPSTSSPSSSSPSIISPSAAADLAAFSSGGGIIGCGSAFSSTMATLFPEHAHVDKLAVLASASVQQSWSSSPSSSTYSSSPLEAFSSSSSTSNYCLASDDSTTTAPSTGPVTPNSSAAHTPSSSDHDFPDDSPLEMSCDAAAQIIARMQGCSGGVDRDYSHPRSNIGCGGQEADYLVQNSAFLQILEAASFFK